MDTVEEISRRIAGEIVLAEDVGSAIKKWREIFSITQRELAQALGISTSVISDYEKGRRKSPGAEMIRKIVQALINEDIKRGSRVIRAYQRMNTNRVNSQAIVDIREFSFPMTCKDIAKIVKGEVIANKELMNKNIYGYTVIDSIKAILEMNHEEFLKLYGLTSERALIFTRVSQGRSPFIAIRVSSPKPGVVVLHGLEKVDKLGLKIAERERIPVILSKIPTVEELVRELRRKTS